jgi:hypothetical protein
MTNEELEYSVGYAVTEDVRDAIGMLPEWAWTRAIDADGGRREGAQVAEITDVLPEALRLRTAARRRSRIRDGKKPTRQGRRTWPEGMRIILRREHPHPGAQLDAFEERDGYRYQAFATNTRVGQIAFLEARHRAHTRVEDRRRRIHPTPRPMLGRHVSVHNTRA